uniref:Uncharacterized protein n=1 Tax=viral metagenome TaxID=1070528 RepID=A0A6C0C100_9ZZZZ
MVDVFYSCASRASRNDEGRLVIDTSYVKNVHGFDVVGRNPTDRGRKASKISLLTNSRRTPLCALVAFGGAASCSTGFGYAPHSNGQNNKEGNKEKDA